MLKLSMKDPANLSRICNALSTELRLSILALIEREQLSGVEIARRLDCSVSTVAANIRILEEAGLVLSELRPAKKGSMKVCSPVYRDVSIRLQVHPLTPEKPGRYSVDTPIGSYMDCEVYPSCGMYSADGVIGVEDDRTSFYLPERSQAQILWFRKGFVEYKIPQNHALASRAASIEFSMELCSETPGFNNIWKSDITLWINGQDAGAFASPGDFGGRRGRLNPDFWREGNTQYGTLVTWRVDGKGTTLNGEPVAGPTIDQLALAKSPYVTIRLGFHPDSPHQGGLNLFGCAFGDYEQDIRMTIRFE